MMAERTIYLESKMQKKSRRAMYRLSLKEKGKEPQSLGDWAPIAQVLRLAAGTAMGAVLVTDGAS